MIGGMNLYWFKCIYDDILLNASEIYKNTMDIQNENKIDFEFKNIKSDRIKE